MKMRIVIDVVNTILFHNPSIPVLYSLILEKHDYIISPAKISKLRKKILTTKRPIESKCSCNNAEVTYRKRWSYLSSLILKECGVYSDIDEIAQEIHFKINDENAHVVIYPSFISILEDLQNECHSIGTLSNGYSSTKSWLTSLKVDKYFDFMLVSSEIGHLKPCPFAFRIALKKAHQNDNMLSVFVGDDLHEDGFGAIHGGFDAAIIIGNSKSKHDSKTKTKKLIYTIPTFKLLPQTLKEVKKHA
jgi:FMN phosphatase YigB (HAD superfamily)